MTRRYDRALTVQELANLPDSVIDFSDIPELDEEFWQNAVLETYACAKAAKSIIKETERAIR